MHFLSTHRALGRQLPVGSGAGRHDQSSLLDVLAGRAGGVVVNLREARAFVAVCEERNFSRAASRLFVAPSTLSETISVLERRSGCVLFMRTTRSVEVTADGLKLLPAARELLRVHESTESLIGRLSETAPLRVGTLYGHATEELRDAACKAGLDISVMIHEMQDLTCGLSDRGVDAAVLAGPTQIDSQIERVHIWNERRVAAIHRSHPLAGRSSVTLDEVDEVGWVRVKVDDTAWQRFWRLDEERGGPPHEVGAAHTSGASIFGALLSGDCAIATLGSFQRIFASDEVTFVDIDDVPSVQVDFAYYPHLVTDAHERLLEALRSAKVAD